MGRCVQIILSSINNVVNTEYNFAERNLEMFLSLNHAVANPAVRHLVFDMFDL